MPEPTMSDQTILVVDDEESQRTVLAGFLKRKGFQVLTAASLVEAANAAARRGLDLVLTDLRMQGGSGLDVVNAVRAANPEVPVIVMTAFGTVASAVAAMKQGAADYLTKPIDLEELEVLIQRTLDRRALVSENEALRAQLESRYRLSGLETQNPRMQEAINLAARAAASRATILVRGESGTGKDLLAKAIHYASPRARHPFVAVNVAALSETLIESELFGHERGAFTGADRERRGRFELADHGTLLLDEIGDLPRGVQVKLLRVLQDQTFERVGGSRTITVDVRILAATNRDLESLVRTGAFREDLFYRLDVVSVVLPPLRERREDIPMLLDQFVRAAAREHGSRVEGVSREAMDALLPYHYPGNIRELENIVSRAVVLARGPLITTADLPAHVLGLRPERDLSSGTFAERVHRFEHALMIDALARTSGVQTRAARLLGMSERHLRYKLRKHGIDRMVERLDEQVEPAERLREVPDVSKR
jgi:two-component system NtrC family response regulator